MLHFKNVILSVTGFFVLGHKQHQVYSGKFKTLSHLLHHQVGVQYPPWHNNKLEIIAGHFKESLDLLQNLSTLHSDFAIQAYGRLGRLP